MDTMTFTKVMGGVCGTLLIFLLGGWVAEIIYHPAGHGDDHHQAYTIEIPDAEPAAEPEPEVPFAEVFAVADASAGERLFRGCQACHALADGQNGTGPHLYGVVDRAVGSVDGFRYSGSLVAVAETWSPENLNAFIENPQGFASGTAMAYPGMDDVEDRANLIAYLATIGG